MLFNSYIFILLFLPISFIAFFGLAYYGRNEWARFLLVMASFVFYGYWDWRYVPLLFISITFNYIVGRNIRKARGYKRSWLAFGIFVNIILLGYFKYAGFFAETVNCLLGSLWIAIPHIILPLGISFFTFTQTAYLIDEYRGEAAQHTFLTYCEFVTIFPHLIAGPIINHKDMLPQFTDEKNFRMDMQNVAKGLTLFAMGLFKKVAIADRLSPWVAEVFNHVEGLDCLHAWCGAIAYTFQLYFDFSGYSEMAIGLGLLFNLRLPVNFHSPYQATSIIDFWRRWHMTLGEWVKHYLYIPLGGNRAGEIRKCENLFLVMGIVGLWHGAGWTFVIWGFLHGGFLIINHMWRRTEIILPRGLAWGLTFLAVVVCWVFFRADSVQSAMEILFAMGGAHGVGLSVVALWRIWKEIAVLGALMTVLVSLPDPITILGGMNFARNTRLQAIFFGALCALTVLLMNLGQSEFLYFQF